MRDIRCKCGGFTLIEILVSLVLLGMLMTAVGVAVQASMTNYRENEDMFRAISTGRQALMRITTDLRTAINVSPYEPAGQCTVETDDGNITYQFDDATDTLYLSDATGAHVLCRNVTALTFTRTLDADAVAISVRISMTVTVGDHSQTVSSAAVIRRNLNP